MQDSILDSKSVISSFSEFSIKPEIHDSDSTLCGRTEYPPVSGLTFRNVLQEKCF